MRWVGKIIGAFLGLLIAGPTGILIGGLLGHLYDAGVFNHLIRRKAFNQFQSGTKANSPFFQSIYPLLGYLAKADGRVSEAEIKMARRVMSQMSLDAVLTARAIRLFSLGKESGFNPNLSLDSLRSTYGSQPAILRLCYDVLKQMAAADGHPIPPAKTRALNQMAQRLGLMPFQFNFSDFDFSKFSQFHQRQQQHQHRPGASAVHSNPYSVLGLKTTASDNEIKKRYRRLMSQYHPDKLVSKNLSKEEMDKAGEKTHEIKSAYDQLKKERGF